MNDLFQKSYRESAILCIYLGPSRRAPPRMPLHRRPPSGGAGQCGTGSEWTRSGVETGRRRIRYRSECICNNNIHVNTCKGKRAHYY